ncbi:hypothetical protein [Reyranella sp.]|jgi:hypothetical protein|uniref:hypothetical protein n=1 Tax=Reyranella sp. TaxID=1929291 RepID=UPI000BD7048C|nr:hypothetical protein [Reyranella sp.]OYY40461.1 MAG: hypothetical protein B7Y57_17275 [Rhodospirillales bacterium 35-66-84]OYZ93078.1 MAG: hypothetical protein B7Y08_18525 [Rhodospirillales bacterium 24-66-33]OZB24206.1 MAG: hypothetical protein B7X63_16485 [Rhodospirillales bacterium 39-66-50]HQS18802.1 hypothetical protein [Reyranella sp.]HQT14889.1 hypothetical protein [Reyranella sp.]
MELSELCEKIAPALGVPATELAEIRRRLREQSDAEELVGKRGRYGGLQATPFNVGFVVAALMVSSPTRAQAAFDTWNVWHLNQEGSVLSEFIGENKIKLTLCPLTGEHLFGEAFKAILSRSELAKSVQCVRIAGERAEIQYLHKKGEVKASKFESRIPDSRMLRRVAELDGRVVRMIAAMLSATEA